ncbi:alpha/beta hydrolase [Kribbella sp. NPDC006257]|uniref:alpha/beta fold hydrolase n=1 Tax=Kribbella sp. NPDC006257 TaxID=3156738 RepID=UPI0033B0C432
MEINGVNLFVAEYGAATAPPLLFIHGHGGGYHYQQFQADLLAKRVRLIAPDQRGVLRSDPVGPGERLDLDLLLEDFEALRERLGIGKWAILGHSAGGNYAVEYAVRHPDSVSAVIFDCPCWDFDANDRFRLPIFARLYDELGDHEKAAECRALAVLPRRLTAEDKTYELAWGLGARFQDLSFHDPARRAEFEQVGQEAGFSEEIWARGMSHLVTVAELYNSKLERLKELSQPSLLIEGIDDLATDPVSVDAYRNNVPGGRVVTFERSGHFPHFEEPIRYAELVGAFVNAHAG